MEEKNNKKRTIIKDIISYAIIILIVILIRVFVFAPVRVDGESMENTLIDGEVLILDKIKYKRSDIQRYDIVVIRVKDPIKNTEKRVIKRVIGLPNESIVIKDNKVYANGEELKNSFASTETANFDLEEIGFLKIPGDSYFVLGDNRAISNDSRYEEIGLIKKDQIDGKVSFRIWPINKIGVVK